MLTEFSHSAAAETESPRRNIAKAVRRVFWRILIFYVRLSTQLSAMSDLRLLYVDRCSVFSLRV